MSRPDVDRISGSCADGKHGRCTGWMVVPYHGVGVVELRQVGVARDISIKCDCEVCEHPDVAPTRHLKDPPQRPQEWNS